MLPGLRFLTKNIISGVIIKMAIFQISKLKYQAKYYFFIMKKIRKFMVFDLFGVFISRICQKSVTNKMFYGTCFHLFLKIIMATFFIDFETILLGIARLLCLKYFDLNFYLNFDTNFDPNFDLNFYHNFDQIWNFYPNFDLNFGPNFSRALIGHLNSQSVFFTFWLMYILIMYIENCVFSEVNSDNLIIYIFLNFKFDLKDNFVNN